MRAFWCLVTERRGGNVIPHSEIVEYGERNGLNPSMIEVLVSVMWSMERGHSTYVKSEQDRANMMNKPSPAKRAKRPRG
jgi:hypothetical protein